MTITVDKMQLVFGIIGLIIGYKLHNQIAGLLASIKSSIAKVLAPKV